MDDTLPLDADELMNFSERIEQLPPAEAEWVTRLFNECLRSRMHESELLAGLGRNEDSASDHSELEAQLAQVALDAAEWLKTLWSVGYMGAGSFPAPLPAGAGLPARSTPAPCACSGVMACLH